MVSPVWKISDSSLFRVRIGCTSAVINKNAINNVTRLFATAQYSCVYLGYVKDI